MMAARRVEVFQSSKAVICEYATARFLDQNSCAEQID
jgi:hypothetical protein